MLELYRSHSLSEAALSALVASRLCHDLGNPVGAMANGVELLLMDGRMQSPEMALISDALRDTTARLEFFRLAYGAARGDQVVSKREILDLLQRLYAGGRLAVDWRFGGDLSRQGARCALLMLSCAEAGLPMGGEVTIGGTDGIMRLEASGPRILMDLDGFSLLQGHALPHDPRPRDVQFVALLAQAHGSQREVSLEFAPDGFLMTLG